LFYSYDSILKHTQIGCYALYIRFSYLDQYYHDLNQRVFGNWVDRLKYLKQLY